MLVKPKADKPASNFVAKHFQGVYVLPKPIIIERVNVYKFEWANGDPTLNLTHPNLEIEVPELGKTFIAGSTEYKELAFRCDREALDPNDKTAKIWKP